MRRSMHEPGRVRSWHLHDALHTLLRHGALRLSATAWNVRPAMLLMMMMTMACSHRVIDFTVLSSKNTELTVARPRGPRVKGEDCVVTILFRFGRWDMKEAVDRAIEKAGAPYDALVDGVVREEPALIGNSCIVVEGTPIVGAARAAVTTAVPSATAPPAKGKK